MIYDVSMAIHPDIQTYKNDILAKPLFEAMATHENQGVHSTTLTIGLHTGTHVDYPLHMIEDGKTSNTEVLEKLIGEAKVFDLMNVKNSISLKDIEKLDIQENDFVLFKTINSLDEEFNFNFVYVDSSAAMFLKNKKIRGVGIDALGIERAQKDHLTHKTLLEKDIVILEGLRLKEVPAGLYNMYCLPLKIMNTEASLARVILIK